MKEYVEIPTALLEETRELKTFFDRRKEGEGLAAGTKSHRVRQLP